MAKDDDTEGAIGGARDANLRSLNLRPLKLRSGKTLLAADINRAAEAFSATSATQLHLSTTQQQGLIPLARDEFMALMEAAEKRNDDRMWLGIWIGVLVTLAGGLVTGAIFWALK